MGALEDVLEANNRHAERGGHGDMDAPPRRRFAVVTCMDARVVPYEAFGIEAGDAHVIRNAGGIVTDDVLRSLAISHWLLGTEEVLVVGHTDCGMEKFTNEKLRATIAEETGADAGGVDFLPFETVEEAVRAGVERVRTSPLLPESFAAHALVYDIELGRLREPVAPEGVASRRTTG